MQKNRSPTPTPQYISTCIDAQWFSDGRGVVTIHSDHTIQVCISPTNNFENFYTRRWVKNQSMMAGMVVPGTTSILLSCKNMPLQMYNLPLDSALNGNLPQSYETPSTYLPSATFTYNTTFRVHNEAFSPLFSIISHPFEQSRFYTGTNKARIDTFDMQHKDPVRTWEPRPKRRRGVGHVSALSTCKADPSVLYAGTSQHAVFHVDQRTKDMDYMVSCSNGVAQILQSDNANYLYLIPKRFCDDNQTIKVWDLRKDDFVAKLHLPMTKSSNKELKMKNSKCSMNSLHGLLVGSPFDSSYIYKWDKIVVETGGVNAYSEEQNFPTDIIHYQDKFDLQDENLYTRIIETNPKNNHMAFICCTEKYRTGYKSVLKDKEIIGGKFTRSQPQRSIFFQF
ncbi:Protein SWT21 [Hanseniaspora osmophila]|uniref:Protein SWT21 n=1 Tax=Hanseniaspora osmophila TaxID=56408 RepID=A0A1E5RMZ6_9ASCO|nr:Protein SWT21 [Hanseniaspora osmophila]